MTLNEPVRFVLERKGFQVFSITPADTVLRAVQEMSDKRVGALLVMEGDRLVGVVSERDYARKVILQNHSSMETPVGQIMTRPVITVGPDQSVAECMTLMTERRIRHLPVVEDGRVTGVLSIGDLVKWTIEAQETLIHHLENYITGKYPG
jgi:CBS domain-containing protein